MNQKTKLTKVIERAIKNKWDFFGHKPLLDHFEVLSDGLFIDMTMEDGIMASYQTNTILFSHDFAKAYWGENKILVCELSAEIGVGAGEKHRRKTIPMWQYHLQQAALSKDPITYYHDND